MIETTLKHFSHKLGTDYWHLEWCTKYHYKMMRRFEIKNFVEAAIRKLAHKHLIKIHLISVMPEHVHMLVTLPHGMTDSRVFQLLKGRSAYLIFRNREHLAPGIPSGTLLGWRGLRSHSRIQRLKHNNKLHPESRETSCRSPGLKPHAFRLGRRLLIFVRYCIIFLNKELFNIL